MSFPFTSGVDIAVIVVNINSAAKSLESSEAGHQKLLHAVEEPSIEVWPRVIQANVSVAIEILTNTGLWTKFRKDKTLSLAEAVRATGADEIMTIRIFRQLTAAGVLTDISRPGYALTSLGEQYLNPDHCALNSLLLQEILPSVMAIPRTLAERGYKAPSKDSGTPFKWANGEELWTFLGAHPHRAMNMVAAELAKLDITDDEVAIVDITGGQGHIMEEVRKSNPGIRGRIIGQDLPSTFDAVADPPPGVEFMPYDMFTPQPVKRAHVYYYRHIIHDWNDEDCGLFLAQVLPLLKEQPKSKLLLVDLVLPDMNVSMRDSIRDFTMFPIGGLERNEKQWNELLNRNGLKIRKISQIWRGTEPEACVEYEVLY